MTDRPTTPPVVGGISPWELLASAYDIGTSPSSRDHRIARQLRTMATRLNARELQLSAVGQFKRGKSSLLNALLGHPVLPTGVIPVTALPTFVRYGPDFALDVHFMDAGPFAASFSDAEHLRAELEAFVAEDANPHNIRGVERLDVRLPATILRGVTLVDTPGIGSTLEHNSTAAESALIECDVALLVVGHDPPIMAAEIAYLKKVRQNAAHVLVALNKIDTAEAADVVATESFLKRALDEAGMTNAEVFPTSARTGLPGVGGIAGLSNTGVANLRSRIEDLSNTMGSRLLVAALLRKAAPLVGDLLFENQLATAALTLPTARLDHCITAFDAVVADIGLARKAAVDGLRGDRIRLLEHLDTSVATLRAEAASDVLSEIRGRAHERQSPRFVWTKLKAGLTSVFEASFERFQDEFTLLLAEVFSIRQRWAESLVEKARETAADLLDIPFQPLAVTEQFEVTSKSAWAQSRRETLGSIPFDIIERFLPASLRRRLELRRVTDEVERVVGVNVEYIRWTVRQAVEDSMRRFTMALDQSLTTATQDVQDAMLAARNARTRGDASTASRLDQLRARGRDLRRVLMELRQRSDC